MAFGGIKRKFDDISAKEISRSKLALERLESRLLLSTLVFDNDPSSSVKKSAPIDLDDSGLTMIESEINSRQDRDCYVFTADRSGLISISMEATENGRGNGLDSMLFAYNSRRKKIASNDDANYRDTNSLVEFYVEAGSNYYVKADGYKNSTGTYRITIESPEENAPLWETIDYSNKIRTATNITDLADNSGNIIVDGGIYPSRDKDYFVFTSPDDAHYSISISAEGSPLDSVLFVYNDKRKLIAKSDDISQNDSNSEVELNIEQGEVIYIKASGWKNTLGTYVLTIDNLDTDSEQYSSEESGTTSQENQGSDSSSSDDNDINDYIGNNVNSTGWLLSITISDYNGYANDLDGPIVDAQIIHKVFTDYYSVPEENVYQITSDTIVNYEAIDLGFNWLANNADSDDYVFVYYSGHGYSGRSTYANDNEGLLLPDNDVIYQNDIEDWLNKIDSQTSKVIMIDSCFAGGFAEIADGVPNTMFIGSAAHDQYAWDEVRSYYPSSEYRGGGIFANWIDYGVFSGNADTNNNGFVGLTEAFEYADTNINLKTGTGRNNQDMVINSSLNLDSLLLIG